MTFANERKHFKMVIWRVLDSCGVIKDKSEGPDRPHVYTRQINSKFICTSTHIRLSLNYLTKAQWRAGGGCDGRRGLVISWGSSGGSPLLSG